MTTIRQFHWLAFVIAIGVMGTPAPRAQAQAPPARPATTQGSGHYDPKRDPAVDLARTVRDATRTNKRILVVVGGEWCSWCHILDRYLKDHADLDRLWQERYVTLFVNFSPENQNKAFLSAYPTITGYPHIFVLEPTGALLHSQDTALLEEGPSYSSARMREFLDRWRPGA